MTTFFLAMFGTTELWVVLGIGVLIFGGRKLPELARAMGSSITQFKRGMREPEGDELLDGPSGSDGSKPRTPEERDVDREREDP